MPGYSVSDLRNVLFTGHAGSGKTTLIESVLHKAGVLTSAGSVEKGNTVCDYEPEEKHHQHSLSPAFVSFDHQGKHVNLIDSPGYPDLMGMPISVMPAVETVAVVVNAAVGIETMTRRLMQDSAERQLCRVIIINKIDVDNVNLEELVSQIQETFGRECLPINLPTKGGSEVADVFAHDQGDADFSSVAEAHTAIVDQIVELDEKLMSIYLEKGAVEPDQLHDSFEQALREGHLVPICFTSGKTGAGVKELVDLMVRLFPNPLEGNPRPFLRGEGEEAEEFHADADPAKHVLAHVVRVFNDPFVGKLGVFRIHQGTVTKDSHLLIGNASKPFKVGHLFKLQGKEHQEIDRGIPGDICAVAKIEDIHYDAVLHDDPEDAHIHLKPLEFPKPMYGLAIEAKSRGDEQKINQGLQRIVAEDPCFAVERDATTHQLVIRGLGELHLRIVLEKLNNRYHCEVTTSTPKIAYRESITAKAEGHHRHKKQSGGAGQFGEVYLRIEPLERGAGFEFQNEVVGGAIPGQFIPAVEKGVRQVLEGGAIAGYPLQDIRVSVYDGKHHAVDSKEVAFITAGKRAFIDAVQKAHPVLLEPVVKVEVTVPTVRVGDIAGDLSGKRGRIQGTDMLPGDQSVVKAFVPLAEVANYQNQLKSVTGGQGSYTMEFSHFDPVPPNIQQQIQSQFNPHPEED